jgi:hypothetical protein
LRFVTTPPQDGHTATSGESGAAATSFPSTIAFRIH